jgi:lysine 2,3-aminomutase
MELTDEEIGGIKAINGKGLGLNLTPYFLSLVDKNDSNDPIRKTVIPRIEETLVKNYEMADPLCEEKAMKVPGLVHRYPDRVLLLVTDTCAAYCRYCTRRRLVGHKEKAISWSKFSDALAYIKEHEEIRDVLISGGDPLLLENERLEKILKSLYNIQHVDMIRIGTKTPVTLPQRITPSLCNMLQKYHPLFISINFAHPNEITQETKQACNRLNKAGIPLGSQTVLLKGVNDNAETMTKLMHELLKIRVRPYYLYQCDLAEGLDHFRTSIDSGIEIINKMRGWTTGYAVPTFVVDAPGGGGKIPVSRSYVIENSFHTGKWTFKNYKGKAYEYREEKD